MFALDLDTIQDKVIQQWLEWNAKKALVFDPNEVSEIITQSLFQI